MSTYDYTKLTPDEFQEFCAAIVASTHPEAQCFPVGHRDGGRDIAVRNRQSGESVVFQVKFFRNPEELHQPGTSVIAAIREEADNVRRFVAAGVKKYVIMTNARGTAVPESGRIDKVQSFLDDEFPQIAAQCLWRDDLDRRLDANISIKWSFPKILRATDLLPILLSETFRGGRDVTEGVRHYLMDQYSKERDLKFRQAELQSDIFSLFIDVPCSVEACAARSF